MTDRRAFMTVLGGAALLGMAGRAGAQKAKSVTIGYLALLRGEDRMSFVREFVKRLGELGYVEGQNLKFVYRSAEGQPDLLPGLATELIRMTLDVLVAGFGTVAAKAAKAAANWIPVVFTAVGDPVGAGVVDSLARPGGNVTGLTDLAAGLQGNRLQLLRDVVPAATHIAVLMNPGTPYAALAYKELEASAKTAAIGLQPLEVRKPEDIAPQLDAAKAADGITVFEDPLTLGYRGEIVEQIAQLRRPAVYGYREFAEAGGLMSYGTDHGAQWRRAAELVDLIVKGAKPSDIPVEQASRFELVVNLKAAKALGITLPPTVMVRADYVIE
jgi:putative tryptophan/tyrosine transport system substrate-binding protein